MFDHISLTQLPRAVQDLVQQTTASEQAKRERRRSALAKELAVEREAAAKEAVTLAGAADRARARREKAEGEYNAALAAERAAYVARNGASIGHDSSINVKASELREPADPRLDELRDELEKLARETGRIPIDDAIETRPAPSPLIRSNSEIKVATRIFSDGPSIQRRIAAIQGAASAVERLRETADIDFGRALTTLRESIPPVALEKELVYDEKGTAPASRTTSVERAGTAIDASYVSAWNPANV